MIRCLLCNHFCNLANGQLGICGVRQNQNGVLMSLNYGRLITEAVDPIEKKPLFHFLPGTFTYSIATVGCNLRCDNCQNWSISQVTSNNLQNTNNSQISNFKFQIPGYNVSPDEVIKRALESGCRSISCTYTEPTIFFEFALACMKLAKEKGLKNVWVSNGYMSKSCLDEIIPYLDAINVDLKFFTEQSYLKNCGCHLGPIMENLKYLAKQNVLLEVTTLLIPGLVEVDGQLKKIAEFIALELSVDIPWHISAFSPEISYRLQNSLSTPLSLIDQAYQIGKQAGLNYIYVGNVWNDDRENTYCPKCLFKIISRSGYQIKRHDNLGNCPSCGFKLPLKIA